MQTANSLEKTLMLGKTEGKRRKGQQRMRCLDASPTQWTWVCASSRRWWRTGKPGVLPSMGSQIVGHDWATEQQSGVSSFHFLRNFHIIFHSGCNNLHSHQQCTKVKVKVLVTQSCPTLCEPVNCSPPGSSVYGILQARILEWVAMPFSRRSSQPRDQTWVFCTASRFFTLWATRATPRLIHWSLNCLCGGIWRCGLWEVIRFRWGPEGGAPRMGLVPL